MKVKNIVRTVAAVAAGAMLIPLAACGGGTAADSGKTKITFLSWDNEQTMSPFIEEFEKEKS